jgi:hypothetical protein
MGSGGFDGRLIAYSGLPKIRIIHSLMRYYAYNFQVSLEFSKQGITFSQGGKRERFDHSRLQGLLVD